MKRGKRRGGYALVAAVASITVFASLALAIMTVTRSAIVSGSGEVDRARADAAVDAGVHLVIHGLLASDPARRWPFDGRTRRAAFDKFTLSIRVEDERGKIPLNRADERSITALLEAEGLTGDRLFTARDSLLDWIDEDDEARPFGMESDDYAPKGYRARNGDLRSIDELGAIAGFDAALIARLRPIVTLRSDGVFDPRFAHPTAIGVMGGGGVNSVEAINRAREIAGQQMALPFARLEDNIDRRPLLIIVEARSRDGVHARRQALVELTGVAGRPYVIHDHR